MNITVNVVLPDILTALIERALAGAPAAAALPPKAATAPAPSQHTVGAAADAAPTTTASPSADTPSCTYDDVKAVVLAYGAKFGRDAIVDLLARYGVTSGKALKTGVYDQFVAEANACIGSGKVAA